MGHGDGIILADAHFPAHSMSPNVICADGLLIKDLLAAILPLFELDTYIGDPVVMMAQLAGDTVLPKTALGYMAVIRKYVEDPSPINECERFAFYNRAKTASVIVMTGDVTKYVKIILKKGVTSIV